MNTLADLYKTIIQAGKPVSISELLAAHPDFSRRSTQRWLNKLLADNKISAIGEGRGRRYEALDTSQAQQNEDQSDDFPAFIPLSADSKDVLAYIEQPVESRHPVGYQRAFLDAYEPNKTYYLSAPIRQQLRRMGDTQQTSQPAGTYGRAILNRFLIDLSWASSHLEGNTYSRLDTVRLIEEGRAADGKAAVETQMILNHKSAIELLVDNAESASYNRFTLLNLHSLLSENLLPNPADEGRIRQHQVEIGKSVFRPLAGEVIIGELLDILLQKASQIKDPFEQSFFMMVHLPYLQPFADVNKRTSRLAANLPLIRANLCPLTFLDVPEQAYSRATLGVYEMTRVELLRDLYLWAYERSTQEYLAIKQQLAEPDPLRLQYRNLIKKMVNDIVLSPDSDPIDLIETLLPDDIQDVARSDLSSLIIEELRRLHEGVLARYGLRPSQFKNWQNAQKGR
ncbi:cell division protein Fic [Endozoicomonas montiporae]|uniref:Cell division protein Fic n=2 Tax=Endozoicomonas montiporae TaxID=1027273 RepID=A0A081NBV7_9GAMM|nr:Fic family protein [Endozoicomonas montiporae]KEQ15930.1 cell division protein Fic [Endozoicomonas montiporae]